ncbi:MAG: flippase-like domain-containing protein [Chitinispirillaceae bacterium]|jgi:uncharacterized membrane protein YbhN (UPF0104 family)|nr:flippase-like domain-containing protein [Chitinispirillaceae bacterium]
MTNPEKKKNPWLKRLGILLAAVPIAWIYLRLDFHAMISLLPAIAWWTAPVVLATMLAGMVLQGVRWWILLRVFLPELPLLRALSYHFMGALYGTVLPSGAAQDIIKTVLVAQKNEMSVSWAAIWLTRIIGLPALALVSLCGFISLDKSMFPKGWEIGFTLFYLSIAALFSLSFSKRLTRPLRLMLAGFVPPRLLEPAERIRESVYCYRDRKGAVVSSLLVTIATQALLVFAGVCAIKGISGKFFFWECFTFIPLMELIAASFPFTPNGMGVRESLSIVFFAYLGLSNEHLGIYVMMIFFLSLIVKCFGVFPLLHGFVIKRRESAA